MTTSGVLYLRILILIAVFAGIPSMRSSAQTAPERKNLQVLKGLPEGHLDKMMDFFAASLNVKCGYCHVIDSTGWHMDLDEKPTKRTARKMIQMVMDLNAKNFGGRTEVTCYTCHRGSTAPASVLALPLPAPAPPSSPAPEGDAATHSLPTVDQVLTMMETSAGGADRMKSVTSRVAKGSLLTSDGREMPIEMISQAPDKFISTMTMKDGAQSIRCYNGTKGWTSSPRGTREMPPSQSEELKKNAAMFPISEMRQLSKTMHISKKDTVNGASAFVLESPAGEHLTERYYVDASSGFLLRKIVLTETPIADIPEQTDYSDYRDVNGVKVPFIVRSSSADARNSHTLRFSSIEHNTPVDAKKFEMPAKKN